MPGQQGKQRRGVRRREVRKRSQRTYCMPLSKILHDLLLHSAAQILLRLESLSGRHTAFLLVELSAPSHSIDGPIVLRSLGVEYMYKAAAAVHRRLSEDQGKLKQE